jgi:ABC-2 type transport system permease protein
MKDRAIFLLKTIGEEWVHLATRKRMVLVVLLGISTIYPSVVSWLYQRNVVVERPAMLVDLDNSALSRQLALDLDATQGIEITQRLDSLETGWEAIKRREAELLLFIPEDFSTKVKQAKRSEVKLWMNSGNMLTYSASYGALNAVIMELNQQLAKSFFHRKGLGQTHAENRIMPLVQQARLIHHPTISYGGFLVPGVMVIVIQQLVLIALAFSVGLSREEGTFVTSARWPFTNLEARGLALLIFFWAGAAFIIFLIFPLFHWPVRDPLAAFLLLCGFSLTLLPLAIIIAQLTHDRYAPFQVLMFLSIPLFMLSGYAWPLEQMPSYLRPIANAMPATPIAQAFRLITMKEVDLPSLAPYLKWIGIQFVCYTALSIVVVRLTAANDKTTAAPAQAVAPEAR